MNMDEDFDERIYEDEEDTLLSLPIMDFRKTRRIVIEKRKTQEL